MKIHIISYDLLRPGQNYSGLWDRLRQLGANRILESQWVLRNNASAEQVRNDLQRFVDQNDRLFVAVCTGEAAWVNVLIDNNRLVSELAA